MDRQQHRGRLPSSLFSTTVSLTLSLLLALFLILSSSTSSTSVYATSSAAKVATLEKLRSSVGYGKPIQINADLFEDLTSKPRNFSLFVLMTALGSEFRCQPCWEFQNEYGLVTAAESRIHQAGRLYFTYLDYKDGARIFQEYKLNTAPVLYHFPATEGDLADDSKSGKPEVYDINRKGVEAEGFVNYVEIVCKVKLLISRPINWQWYGFVTLSLLGMAAVGRLLKSYIVWVISSRKVWMGITITLTLLFSSGQMWNQIRGAPYSGMKNNREMEIFAGGFGNQYGIETQILAFVYGLIGMSVVFLATQPPAVDTSKSPVKARVMVVIGVVMFVVVYSYLLKVFRNKIGYYPYSLLL